MIASHQIDLPAFLSFYRQFPIMYPGLLSFINAKAIRFLLAQKDPPVVNHPEQQKPLLQIILMLILTSFFFNNGITHQQRRAGSPARHKLNYRKINNMISLGGKIVGSHPGLTC